MRRVVQNITLQQYEYTHLTNIHHCFQILSINLCNISDSYTHSACAQTLSLPLFLSLSLFDSNHDGSYMVVGIPSVSTGVTMCRHTQCNEHTHTLHAIVQVTVLGLSLLPISIYTTWIQTAIFTPVELSSIELTETSFNQHKDLEVTI